MIRLLTVALLFASFHAAAEVNLTELNNNTPADADDVMGNFNALNEALPPSDCSTNQIIKWDGSAWVCATDSLAGLACSEGQTIAHREGAWQCDGCVPPGTAITDSNFDAAITDWFANGDASQYGDITKWCTRAVTDMREAFRNRTTFNEDISAWDTINVTDMENMFYDAIAFNQDISGWNTSNVTDMRLMFSDASAFNQSIGGWDTSKVTGMRACSMTPPLSIRDIGGWNTSNVTDMAYMFAGASLSIRSLAIGIRVTWQICLPCSTTPPLLIRSLAAGTRAT